MERIIELMSMPYMQMSILNRIELALHIIIITILCSVMFFGFKKMFK